jgi:hypothetical protein
MCCLPRPAQHGFWRVRTRVDVGLDTLGCDVCQRRVVLEDWCDSHDRLRIKLLKVKRFLRSIIAEA